MGRLPKKITTHAAPKLTLRAWTLIGLGLVFLGLYACYNLYKPVVFMKKTSPIIAEPVDFIAQMEEPTTQDLQALPIAQEAAEESISMAEFQSDELVQIFETQEKNATKTDLKPKEPLVVKRSLGLV